MTALRGSSLKTSIRYLPRFSELTSPAFSKTSMCLANGLSGDGDFMPHDQARRELVERLLLALRELVQHQPPCWVRECLEDQVFVHARIQYATTWLHVKGRFSRLAGTTSPAVCGVGWAAIPDLSKTRTAKCGTESSTFRWRVRHNRGQRRKSTLGGFCVCVEGRIHLTCVRRLGPRRKVRFSERGLPVESPK